MLSWASLTVNNYTFIINNQQMIDWAINGAMEVQDAGVCNKMHDASAEFHYHLFRCKHKSYYGAQDTVRKISKYWASARPWPTPAGYTGSWE